jgi:hypothetical protein
MWSRAEVHQRLELLVPEKSLSNRMCVRTVGRHEAVKSKSQACRCRHRFQTGLRCVERHRHVISRPSLASFLEIVDNRAQSFDIGDQRLVRAHLLVVFFPAIGFGLADLFNQGIDALG